jgi:serine protease Do
MHLARCVVLIVVALTLAACQTTGSSRSSAAADPLVDRSYHPFFSPADHVDELLAGGEVERASQVWTHQWTFFAGKERESAIKATAALRVALSERLAPRLDRERQRIEAIAWPAPPSRWAEVKAVMTDGEALKTELEAHRVLTADSAPDERHRRFLAALDAKSTEIRAGAKTAFRAGDEAFLSAYPVSLTPTSLIAEARETWSADLAKASPEAIVAFRDRHEKALDSDGYATLGRLHYEASLRARPEKGLQAILAALDATRAVKLPLRGIAEDRVAVVQIAKGATPFAVGIDKDMPFAMDVAELDAALDRKADLLLILDVRSAQAERRVVDKGRVRSEYEIRIRHEENPDYVLAKADLREAEREYRRISRKADKGAERCGGGLACAGIGVFVGLAVMQAESEVEAARARVLSTPPELPKPVYQHYSFTKVATDVTRSAALGYYLVDRSGRVFMRGVFPIALTKRFDLGDGIHEKDRHHLGRIAGEDEVVAFETAAMTVPLSAILAEIAKAERRPLPAIAEIRREIVAGRATAPNGQGAKAVARAARSGG